MPLSRRQVLRAGSIYGGGLWISLQLPRPRAAAAASRSSQPETLTAGEWKTIEAVTARIIPTDAEPGAREAACVNFIDKALAHEDARALPLYQLGVAGLDAASRHRFGKLFAELADPAQDELLAAVQEGRAAGWPKGPISSAVFFETVRGHTLIGFLADPKYGGNRDHGGWKLVGYPGPRHAGGGYTPAQMVGEAPIRPVWAGRD